MPSTKRSIGIIGVGFGAQVHAPGFRSEGWDVAAICSRNREKVQKAAADAGIAGIHTDPMELIHRDDLDAVAIITPPGSHHALSIAALKAGKHVLCEKPFALDVKQAAEMRNAAEQSGLTAMVAHEFRHTPQRAYIKQLLAEDYIGKFQLCTMELFLDRYVTQQPRPLTWNAYKADGGGLLGALGSHYIDGLRYWFGDVATVTGRIDSTTPGCHGCGHGQERQGRDGRYVRLHADVQERRDGDDDRVLRHHPHAWRKDRGHGRQRYTARGAAGTESAGGWHRRRQPQRRTAEGAGHTAAGTRRSPTRATIG